MEQKDEWVPYMWYCPNCGKLVAGYCSKNGTVKGVCENCAAPMRRRVFSEEHICIDVYDPMYQGKFCC